MEKIFDTLIDSFLDNKVGITDDFLSVALAANLKFNLNTFYTGALLVTAGTGHNSGLVHNTLVRSDKIYWLDRAHNDVHENAFFDLMDQFIEYLNRTCYAGVTACEFHYTLYEKGSFYTRHIDQFKNDEGRKYSMIMYLNESWEPMDGGELCIHHSGSIQNISPNSGKSVFFKSNELEHEVLMTHKPRLSITGWLK